MAHDKRATAGASFAQMVRASTEGDAAAPKRKAHPALTKRAAAIKAAHAHLSANKPGFREQSSRRQFQQVQAHVRRQGKC